MKMSNELATSFLTYSVLLCVNASLMPGICIGRKPFARMRLCGY